MQERERERERNKERFVCRRVRYGKNMIEALGVPRNRINKRFGCVCVVVGVWVCERESNILIVYICDRQCDQMIE